MRILLDTNVLLWSGAASSRLDRQTREMLEDPDNKVLFSAASIWEIAIKAGLGRADFRVTAEAIIASAHQSGFTELPITASVAAQAARLPAHHKDPFDRMLIAQAMAEPAKLLTTDRTLLRYSELVTLIERRHHHETRVPCPGRRGSDHEPHRRSGTGAGSDRTLP